MAVWDRDKDLYPLEDRHHTHPRHLMGACLVVYPPHHILWVSEEICHLAQMVLVSEVVEWMVVALE